MTHFRMQQMAENLLIFMFPRRLVFTFQENIPTRLSKTCLPKHFTWRRGPRTFLKTSRNFNSPLDTLTMPSETIFDDWKAFSLFQFSVILGKETVKKNFFLPWAEEEGILNSNCPKNMQSTLCCFNGIFVFFKKKKTSKQNLRPKGFRLCGFTHACEKLRREFGPVHLRY